MTQYLLRKQEEEIWKEKTKEFWSDTNSLLKRKRPVDPSMYRPKKQVVKTVWDRFKSMRFTIRGENLHIWETIKSCKSKNGLNRLYDTVYPEYLSGSISTEQWRCFENLIEIPVLN